MNAPPDAHTWAVLALPTYLRTRIYVCMILAEEIRATNARMSEEAAALERRLEALRADKARATERGEATRQVRM